MTRIVRQSEFYGGKQVIILTNNYDDDYHIVIRTGDNPSTDKEVYFDWCFLDTEYKYRETVEELRRTSGAA